MKKVKLTELMIDRVAVVPVGANQHADIVFFKHKQPTTPEPAKPLDKEPVTMKIKKIDRSKLTDEQKTSLDAILKAANIEEEAEEPQAPTLTEEILKALPQNVQDILKANQAVAEKAKADAADAIAKAAKAEADAAIEKDARLEGEFIKTAESILKHLPGTVTDNAKLLYRLKKTATEADFKALEALLKAGNEGIEKATKTIGEDGGEPQGAAYTQLLAKAEELRKADPKLTHAKAFAKASSDNPELVAQYRKEKGITVV